MLPSKGFRLDDPNQNMHPRMSAHHEDSSKTANGHGKSSKANVCGKTVKLWLGKKLILPSDFKTISFQKFILCETAAGKLSFAVIFQSRWDRSPCN